MEKMLLTDYAKKSIKDLYLARLDEEQNNYDKLLEKIDKLKGKLAEAEIELKYSKELIEGLNILLKSTD